MIFIHLHSNIVWILNTPAGIKLLASDRSVQLITLECNLTKKIYCVFSCIIIPMSHIFKKMLKRNLIYTAVSRAKQNVIVIGSKQAFREAVINTNYDARNTLFAWRLQMEHKKHSVKFKQLAFV